MTRLLPAYWTGACWQVDVPVSLPPGMLRAAARWVEQVQRDRWRSLPHGDERDALGRALAHLQAHGLQQRLALDRDGRGVAFAATEKMHPDRTIVDLGGRTV